MTNSNKSYDLKSKISQMTGKDNDALNSIYDNLLNMVTCDKDCQERANIDDLRQKWKAAEENKLTAPELANEAEKNYLIAKNGEDGYNKTIFKRYSNQASKQKQTALNNYKSEIKEINALIMEYDINVNNTDKLKDLLNIRLKENNQLKKKLDTNKKDVQTNDRKVVYETWAREGLSKTYKIILIFYILAALLFTYYSFMSPTFSLKNIRFWMSIIFLVVLPFIIKFIAQLFKNIYNNLVFFLSNKAPKDVYSNL